VGKESKKHPNGKKKNPTQVNQVGEEDSREENESDGEMSSASSSQ
jgi:hypothetical protein